MMPHGLRALAQADGPRLVVRELKWGRSVLFCTGCGWNYARATIHLPGSEDCQRARREADESRST